MGRINFNRDVCFFCKRHASLFFTILLCLTLFNSCQPKEKKSIKNKNQENWQNALLIDSSVFIPVEKKSKKIKQIELLFSFFHSDWNYSNYDCLLLKNENSPKYPFSDIYFEMRGEFKEYKATLMALTDISKNLSVAKVGFFKTTKWGFTSVGIIYDFLIVEKNDEFKLTNIFCYRTRNWKEKTFGNIDYFAYPDHLYDKEKMVKMQKFNNRMADYFNVNPISFKYYICKNYKQIERVRGFDFERLMYVDDPYGGYSFPNQKLIFAGNNSEYYPHELVHLYVHHYFPFVHSIVDEGLATYFGGSLGMSFEKHLHILKHHLKNHKVDVLKELMTSSHYTLTDKVSLKYSVGALLCDLSVKKCGKQGLITLLDSGKSNEDLMLAIQNLFGIDKSEFNGFIEKELENYE